MKRLLPVVFMILNALFLCLCAGAEDFYPDASGAYSVDYVGEAENEYVLLALKGIYSADEYLDALQSYTDGDVVFEDSAQAGEDGIVRFYGFVPKTYADSTVIIGGEELDVPVLAGYLRADGAKDVSSVRIYGVPEYVTVSGLAGKDVSFELEARVFDSFGFESLNAPAVEFSVQSADGAVSVNKNTVTVNRLAASGIASITAKCGDASTEIKLEIRRCASSPFEIRFFSSADAKEQISSLTLKGVQGVFEPLDIYTRVYDMFGDEISVPVVLSANGKTFEGAFKPDGAGEYTVKACAEGTEVYAELAVTVTDRPAYEGNALILFNLTERCRNEIDKIGKTVFISDEAGKDVFPGTLWTTESALNTLKSALETADGALTRFNAGELTDVSLKKYATSLESALNKYSLKDGVRVDAESISLSAESLMLSYGRSASLKVSLSPSKNTEKIVWSSSDSEIAFVSDTGKVTAKGQGYAVITAETRGGLSAQCLVYAYRPVTKITLSATKASLVVGGDDLLLSYTALPAEHNDIISWSSSKPDVATVDENGRVHALSRGTAKITVKCAGGKSASCMVTVGLAADSVKFTALKSTSLAVGKSVSLKASAYREDGQKPVSTSVSYRIIEGEEFAEIDGKGKLTGIAVGTVVVAADAEQSLNNAYETITINVCIPATSVKLSESKYSLVVGGKPLELEATVLPLNNTDTLIWESSNEAVAAVDENGTVTAVGKGSAKIYAKTGSGKSAYCTVSVGIPADAVKFSSVKATSLAAGKSMMLKASAYRLDGQKPVSTSVIYEIVKGGQHAEISSSGKLTAISVGSVTVRAYAQSSLNDAYDEITIDVVVPITSLKFAFSSSALALGYGGKDFSALLTVAPLDNTDKITWESSDEDVAVVDENGFVTPVSAGKTKIYARSGSGKSAYCTVNVGLAADMIDISGCTKTVAVGKTLTLKGTASRLDGKKPISTALIWESDDESIVSVTPQGKLTAGSVPGIVTITARAEAGDVCESFLLTVTPLMYKLTADIVETAVGESFDLYKALHAYQKDGAEISLEDYCDVTFTCSSAYAKVENGALIGIKEGRVTVKASVKCASVSKSAYIYVTVVKPAEAQIEAELASDDSHTTESETPEIAEMPEMSEAFENSDNAEAEEAYEQTEEVQTENGGAEQSGVAVQNNTEDSAQVEEPAESVEQSE